MTLQVALGTYYQLHQIINQLDTRKVTIKTNLLYLFLSMICSGLYAIFKICIKHMKHVGDK
jgi:hypothetical protein